MTKLYYCLAKTVVHGEIVIQGNPVTYSASSSAFDSSNVSFKDAAKVATINSNTAAIIAARKVIDSILIEYAYVLADVTITSMINNNLKTTVNPILPIFLKDIADTFDNINYVLNRNTTIKENNYLLVPGGKSLTVPETFDFTNYGIIQIGGTSNDDGTAKGTQKSSKLSPQCDSTGVLTITIAKSIAFNYNSVSIGSPDNPDNACGTLKIITSLTTPPTLNNYGKITNNRGGTIDVQGVIFRNRSGTTGIGSVNNTDLTAQFKIK